MFRHLTYALLSCAILAPAPSQAQSIDDVFQITVRPGWRERNGDHIAGLQIDLAEGWKTYWRQPGDVGIPPQFNWAGSKNITDVQVLWPAPKVSWDYGSRSVGYENQVVFPLVVDTENHGTAELKAQVLLGVCEEICIPVEVNIRATLPAKGAHDQAITTSIQKQPVPKNYRVECSFGIKDGATLANLSIKMPSLGNDEDIAVELPNPSTWIGTPKTKRNGSVLVSSVEMLSNKGEPVGVVRSTLRTTVFAEGKAVEIVGCHAP